MAIYSEAEIGVGTILMLNTCNNRGQLPYYYPVFVISRSVASTVEPNYLAGQVPTSEPLDPWSDITANIKTKIALGILP